GARPRGGRTAGTMVHRASRHARHLAGPDSGTAGGMRQPARIAAAVSTPNRCARILLLAMLAWMPLVAGAAGVYVAGQGFTLEQAVEQALRENEAEGSEQAFWIVAAGDAARAVARGEGVAGLLEQIRSRGGLVYVCERDLQGGQSGALPPGVGLIPVAAVSSGGVLAPADVTAIPESERGYRLMLRVCEALQ